jgi:hypothetical protein
MTNRRELLIESSAACQRNVLAYCQANWLDPVIDDEQLPASDLLEEQAESEDDAVVGTGTLIAWQLNVLDTSSGSHFVNVVMPLIETLGGEVVENTRLHREPEIDARTGKTIQNGRRRMLVIRLAVPQHSRLIAEFNRLRLRARVISQSADALTIEIHDRDLYTLFDFVRDYEAGKLERKAVAIVSNDAAKYDAGLRSISGTVARRVWDEDAGHYVIRQVQLCPGCGQVVDALSVETGRCKHSVSQPIFMDLGYALPPLSEEIIRVEMGPELKEHYRRMDEDLRNFAAQQLAAHKDSRWFSVWWNAVLRRPNSAFRDEMATLEGEEGFELPAVVNGSNPHDLLPKEAKLIELTQRNMSTGRRTLVFVEQTASRDIRPRLQSVLEANLNGLRVATLSSSLAPTKREAWLRTVGPTLDVLLVNPRLVRTGLDLIMFSDIIFFELTYSLCTLWQAMRRVSKLGQSNPVTTTFLV